MAIFQTQDLHFILIPFMSPSHIIPLMDLAKLLAQRPQLTVTVITTPLNAITIQSIIDRAQKSTHVKIGLSTVPFPAQEAGLPPGLENTEALPSPDAWKPFFIACTMLQQPIKNLLKELQPRPSCIISSNVLPWTVKVASNLKIPRYDFQTVSCFSLLLGQTVMRMNVDETVGSDSEPFVVPNMPDEIVITKSQTPQETERTGGGDKKGIVDQMREAELLTRGMVVNSFYEMESKYVDAHMNMGRKVWCIGPVSLCNKDMWDKLERGKKASIDEDVCLKWLDSMEPSSVIYACFGSLGLGRISEAQIIETGLGLEASNRPFIWTIRKKDLSSRVEKWLEEEKFEERVKGRGLIMRGWAPQVLILSHPSVGGFITHCGWNSTLEAVSAGVPMITWPMFAEQFYNEKLIVNVLKIGVRTGVEAAMKMGEVGDNEVYVSTDQLKKAIKEVMDSEEKGERIRRAGELRDMAKKATEEGGSSNLNITMLIQDVVEQLKLK
uniref:Glycosyltransferase n=1 Tax=Panax ginseng TaxID=4054 RepID=A0A0D5ZDJ5_PANGI|nr:UGTPg28 [Panax ginseng]